MTNHLIITVPDSKAQHPNYFLGDYSLYADGLHINKLYVKEKKLTLFTYPYNSVVILYYTYETSHSEYFNQHDLAFPVFRVH